MRKPLYLANALVFLHTIFPSKLTGGLIIINPIVMTMSYKVPYGILLRNYFIRAST